MVDPVLAADGVTYERAAIALWMQTQDLSPVTNQPLFHKNLVTNERLKAAIQSFQSQRASAPPPFSRGNSLPAQPLPSGWQPMSSGGHPVYVNPSSGEISHEQPSSPAQLASSGGGGGQQPFMSRHGNAAFKDRAPVQYQAVWEWENDAGTAYNPFNDAVATVLEAQFLRHARDRTEASASFNYERPEGGTWLFNFDFMMQTNPATGGMRAVRRT